MNLAPASLTHIFIAFIGAAITYGSLQLMNDDSLQREQVIALENRVQDLELQLLQTEEALAKARAWSWDFSAQSTASDPHKAVSKPASDTDINMPETQELVAEETVDSDKILRDLSTISDRDPRSFPDKVNDFLAANPGEENIAIASKGVVDMAENRENLPDHELAALYHQQKNPDLKRVVAQVLSARGDNSLIEKQVNEMQSGLRSDNPAERQKALVELAKTRYASAADAVAPLLKDENIGVKLDALLALRATGNQNHLHLAEALVNHPDPSVSWLANDVVSNLQNLSNHARTRLANADIVAELPVLASQ